MANLVPQPGLSAFSILCCTCSMCLRVFEGTYTQEYHGPIVRVEEPTSPSTIARTAVGDSSLPSS